MPNLIKSLRLPPYYECQRIYLVVSTHRVVTYKCNNAFKTVFAMSLRKASLKYWFVKTEYMSCDLYS